VTFAVGPAGALRFVRVSQSSGNAWLDQLALATVRNAAPFPPPPVPQRGLRPTPCASISTKRTAASRTSHLSGNTSRD
jgi:protein TonB